MGGLPLQGLESVVDPRPEPIEDGGRCLASIGRFVWPTRGALFKCELRRWLTRHVGL